MTKDVLGRPILTAADLDAMTPEQRKAAFEASIVTDLDQLPPEYLARLLADAERLRAGDPMRSTPWSVVRTELGI